MNVSFTSKCSLYYLASPKKYPACGGHAKKGDPKTLPAAGRDVHRAFGKELRLSYVLLWLTTAVP
jgi:hypothetical protein